MIRCSLISLLGACAAGLVAWRLGGRLGAGTLAGFLLGASASGLGVLYVRHTLAHRPSQAFQALLVAFGLKLGLLCAGALVLRFVAEVAARLDWQAFVVAFAAAAAIILPVGVWEALSSAGPAARSHGKIDPERVP